MHGTEVGWTAGWARFVQENDDGLFPSVRDALVFPHSTDYCQEPLLQRLAHFPNNVRHAIGP